MRASEVCGRWCLFPVITAKNWRLGKQHLRLAFDWMEIIQATNANLRAIQRYYYRRRMNATSSLMWLCMSLDTGLGTIIAGELPSTVVLRHFVVAEQEITSFPAPCPGYTSYSGWRTIHRPRLNQIADCCPFEILSGRNQGRGRSYYGRLAAWQRNCADVACSGHLACMMVGGMQRARDHWTLARRPTLGRSR
jgi:hypothetical protein